MSSAMGHLLPPTSFWYWYGYYKVGGVRVSA
jgi:hypothetical protein